MSSKPRSVPTSVSAGVPISPVSVEAVVPGRPVPARVTPRAPNSPRRICVVGCGNPWRRDDGLGIAAVHQLCEELNRVGLKAVGPRRNGFAAFEHRTPTSVTSIELIETDRPAHVVLDNLVGVDHAAIVDALMNGGKPGTLYQFAGVALAEAIDRAKAGTAGLSYHDADVLTALALAEVVCPERLPETIALYGIEPKSLDLDRGLTPPIAESLPLLVTRLLAQLLPQSLSLDEPVELWPSSE